jgi:hypothetical protein
VYRDTVVLEVPLPPATVSIGGGLGVDYIEVTWPPSLSPGIEGYRVYRSPDPGGPYAPASADAVSHTVFLDTGLSSSTRYYYTVTAIDGSGNESARSAELSVSTNAPPLGGWPSEMEGSLPGSPAVGDIDGDGDLEVVVGNKLLYAWHHNGDELRDGDNYAQTWGVLAEHGEEFAASVALARLDDQPGLDIVAADLYTRKVYCVDYNGDLLPGWPQDGENEFRAAPAVGDLDGDGLFEVIAVDAKGVVYAWHADGLEFRDGDGNPATYGVFYRTPATTFHFQSPAVCDIDQDSLDEIVLGTRVDSVYALNGDGSTVPGWPVALNTEIAGAVAAGDIDGDGLPEIFARTKGEWGKAYVVNHDGTVASGWPVTIPFRDIFFTPSPALADLDNNGTLEAVVPGWDRFDCRIYLLDHQGNTLPGWPVVASGDYTESSPVVADVNGDGGLDVLLAGESGLVHAFDLDGDEIDGFPVPTGDAVRSTPFVVDLDLDGDTELVVSGWDRNLYVWDLTGAWDPNQTAWPTFQSNVHRNGKVGYRVPTAITPPRDISPARLELAQNYPNPFNPATTIRFHVPAGSSGIVRLRIFDVTGALVNTLVERYLPPGEHVQTWDGVDNRGNRVGTGIYFCRLEQAGSVSTRKMLLIK